MDEGINSILEENISVIDKAIDFLYKHECKGIAVVMITGEKDNSKKDGFGLNVLANRGMDDQKVSALLLMGAMAANDILFNDTRSFNNNIEGQEGNNDST